MDINATLIAEALTFALLIWFTMKLVWPFLLGAMDARAARIARRRGISVRPSMRAN